VDYKPSWYKSPINLPRGRSGKMMVRHRIIPVGSEVRIVGMRQAMLRGMVPVSARLDDSLKVHELVEEDVGVWMSDLPEELNQIAELLATVKPRGRVLVGGLGLGILAKAVSERLGVDDVFVVEHSPDVIKLCRAPGYRVQEDDIGAFLRWHVEPFDFYLLDTWQGTNEGTWWDTVLPLRRTIRNRWGRKPVVHCWAEDIMLGQVFGSLVTKPPHWYYRELQMPMSKTEARRFVSDVGLPAWERKFGAAVDTVLAPSGD